MRTRTKVWTVHLPRLRTNSWFDFHIAFNQREGLVVFSNKKMVAKTMVFIIRKVTTTITRRTTAFLLGKASVESKVFARFYVAGFKFLTTGKVSVLQQNGVLPTGKRHTFFYAL